jgi:hypothetical protein
MPLPPLLLLLPPLLPPELDEVPAPPRVPADVLPALRLAVLDVPLGAEAMLLPAEAALT